MFVKKKGARESYRPALKGGRRFSASSKVSCRRKKVALWEKGGKKKDS